MGIENQRYAVVNLSSTKIPVYEKLVHSSIHTGTHTVGGNVIGHIHQYEFYTVIKNEISEYFSSFKIYFLDGNNKVKYGYIETSPGLTLGYYSWNAQQEPYFYYNSNGSKLVASAKATISGKAYRVFTVKKAVSYKNPSGTTLGTIPVGTQLACQSSTTGKTYPGYMVFYYKRSSSTASWSKISSSNEYVFVDLGLANGAMPNNRSIW